MATTGPKNRKPKKSQIEDLYKILGVRSNATQESIKKNYIQMVKKYPPEQHPEQFQQIRRAYDTLRDPIKRKEYDFKRKYGGSVEQLLEEAFQWMSAEQWSKAEKLFKQVMELSPESAGAYLGMLQISLYGDDYDEAIERSHQLLAVFSGGEQRLHSYVALVHLWFDFDYPETALLFLDKLMLEFPAEGEGYYSLLAAIYQDMGKGEEAYLLIEENMINAGVAAPDQYQKYLDWINAMIYLGKWQYWSRLQPNVKRFLLSVSDEDDRLIIVAALKEEALHYKTEMMFKEAEVYIDLALLLDRLNLELKGIKKELQYMQRLKKEVDQLPKDWNLPRVLGLKVHMLFLEDCRGNRDKAAVAPFEEMLEEMQQGFPDQNVKGGVEKLRAKYKLLYARYRDQIEEFVSSWS